MLLIQLFHNRWAAPVLALLSVRGRRVAELQGTLGAGRESLRRALTALAAAGLAAPNPGYGHPLRPEWVATDAGRSAGEICARLLADARHRDLLLRKWSVPTLAALAEPRRFSELRSALQPVTPRALALALKDLEASGLVEREVVPGYPPTTTYRTTARGAWLRRDL
jgi:DNA-binding HxlR family transcriptional regulator